MMQNPQPNIQSQVYPNQAMDPQIQTTRDPKRIDSYSFKAAVATGAIQLSCGVASLVFGIVVLSVQWTSYEYNDKCGSGIWAGILFIATGTLGIKSSTKKRALIISYLVMSIISSVAAAIGIMFTGGGISEAVYYDFYNSEVNQTARAVSQLFNVLLLVVLLLGGISAIVGSAFGCCSGLCCTQTVIVQERMIYVQDGSQPSNVNIQPSYPATPPAYVVTSADSYSDKTPIV